MTTMTTVASGPPSSSDPKRRARLPSPFVQGVAAPFRGFGYMWRHKGLWRFGVWPAIVNTLISLALLALVVLGLWRLHSWWEPPFVTGWVADVIEVIVGIFLTIIALAVAVLLWAILHGTLCGHFYSKLAAEVERRLGLDESQINEVPMTKQLVDVLRDLGLMGLVFVGLFALQLIPILGALLGVPLVLYFQYLILGRDFLDHPLSLRGARWHQKRRFIARHRTNVLGLGFVVSLIAFIPIVSAVLLTTAVTGSVLLHRRLAAEDEANGWDWRSL